MALSVTNRREVSTCDICNCAYRDIEINGCGVTVRASAAATSRGRDHSIAFYLCDKNGVPVIDHTLKLCDDCAQFSTPILKTVIQTLRECAKNREDHRLETRDN